MWDMIWHGRQIAAPTVHKPGLPLEGKVPEGRMRWFLYG